LTVCCFSEKKWEIKIKKDKVQLRFQQNSWYRTQGHKVELSKINENDNKTHILWQWKATNSKILTTSLSRGYKLIVKNTSFSSNNWMCVLLSFSFILESSTLWPRVLYQEFCWNHNWTLSCLILISHFVFFRWVEFSMYKCVKQFTWIVNFFQYER
jgi:hypothetical protein